MGCFAPCRFWHRAGVDFAAANAFERFRDLLPHSLDLACAGRRRPIVSDDAHHTTLASRAETGLFVIGPCLGAAAFISCGVGRRYRSRGHRRHGRAW